VEIITQSRSGAFWDMDEQDGTRPIGWKRVDALATQCAKDKFKNTGEHRETLGAIKD